MVRCCTPSAQPGAVDRICDVEAPRSCPRKWGPELNGFARKPASFSDSFWNWEGGHTRTDFFQRSAYNNQGRTQHSSKVANEPPARNQPPFSFFFCFLPPRLCFSQMNRKRVSLTWRSFTKLECRKSWSWRRTVAVDADGSGGVLVIHRDRNRQRQGVNVVHKA